MGQAHTPGPWETDGVYVIVSDVTMRSIADCGKSPRISRVEQQANARLIAAAPTMFEYIASSAQNGCAEAKQIMGAINGPA